MSPSQSGDQVPATPAGQGNAETTGDGGGQGRDHLEKAPAGASHAGFALLLTLSMAQFVVVLDFTIVNVALPSIQHGLHVATTTLQWLVSGYAVAFGGFLLLGGRLADVYGRARLYRIGLVVFVLASIAGGLAVEPGLLIASRVVQGIGAAMLAPAGLSLLVTSYPDERERSHALGIYGAIVSTGFAAGAVLGGLLVEVTWRLVFFVNAPVGVALLIASFRLLPPDPPSSKGQLDIPGAITVTAGVALLVYAVARAGDTLKVTQPALLFGAAVVLLGAFTARERRAQAPILDLALLKDRGILGANLALITVGAFSAGQVLLVTLYLQEGRGLSPLLTGLCFVPQAAGAFALAGPAGRLVPALGPRRALAAGLSLALLALAGNAVAVLGGSLPGLLAGSFLLGIANRLSQVSSTLAGTQGPVAARSEGTASGLLTATRQCGSALGVAILSATLVAVDGGTSHRTGVAMFVAAGFALAGLLATRIVPPGPPHPRTPQPHHLFRHHAGGIP
jgi:EmrB/QacA subfamily drug resistance transporter